METKIVDGRLLCSIINIKISVIVGGMLFFCCSNFAHANAPKSILIQCDKSLESLVLRVSNQIHLNSPNPSSGNSNSPVFSLEYPAGAKRSFSRIETMESSSNIMNGYRIIQRRPAGVQYLSLELTNLGSCIEGNGSYKTSKNLQQSPESQHLLLETSLQVYQNTPEFGRVLISALKGNCSCLNE